MILSIGCKLAYMTPLSERIQAALEHAHMDQSELARRTGITSVAVNGWCTGATKSIKGENLLKAAAALKVSPQWLAYGKGTMTGDLPSLSLDAASVKDMLDELERRGETEVAQLFFEYARRKEKGG
ncbi:helix-turn-helix domain-containing protein [Chromobacterium haemolyticum]|nr:helix-turn-helix transcriptional regulator [Chromobacterium haemolyticum]